MIARKLFIEDQFQIVDKESSLVPFVFNNVQEEYYRMLIQDYGQTLEGVREIVLKARQEGVSSMVLGLFTVDFLTMPNSVSICISHRKDSTDILFKKVKRYVESYCEKQGWDPKDILETDNRKEMENKLNKAYFYIGTAGTKVGGRGGTARNLLLSESAFYPDTSILTAREIIEATAQQIPQGKGMIFVESTANGYGNYYQMEWERAVRGESTYKPRFFGWEKFYDEKWIMEKRKDFQDERIWKQEYPRTENEAFINSGNPFFDTEAMEWIMNNSIKDPIKQGRLAADGQWM